MAEAEGSVDHGARNMASLAAQEIRDHKDQCGERWKRQYEVLGSLTRGVETLHTRINTLLVSALGGSMAIAGVALWYLLTHAK